MSGFAGLKSDFINRTSSAYNRFQKEKVPFSALRLGISGADSPEINRIVAQHLRETDEILGQGDNSYAILMQGTPFEAAIAVSKRLASGLMKLNNSQSTIASGCTVNASFEIIGCTKGSDNICRTHLEFNNDLASAREERAIPKEVRMYMQNDKISSAETGRSQQSLNVVV